MKKVALSFVLAALSLVFSCKEKPSNLGDDPKPDTLAIADTTPNTPDYLYVTAPSGLTLREFNNLNSEKLAVMPYGTKVKIITSEKNSTMTVGGIKGGMNEVEFNHKSGYAFNGYLSKFFPPEKDIKAKVYVEELNKLFPEASYTESVGGTASNPSNTQIVELPTNQWHEAFYVAQKLYRIPSAFSFPNPKGKDKEVISDAKKTPTLWISELQIERTNDILQSIIYSYAGEGFASTITITKEGDKMKIKEHMIAD